MDKTRTEYESIKARWRLAVGVTSDNILTPDDGRPPYLCATLREECAATPEAVASVLARMGALAVLDGAYLTMNVHVTTVTVQLLVSTNEVDPQPYVVQTPTPPEVLADVSGRYNVGLQPCKIMFRSEVYDHECPKCGRARAWCDNCHSDHHAGGWDACRPHADQGVTPDERAGLGVGGGEE